MYWICTFVRLDPVKIRKVWILNVATKRAVWSRDTQLHVSYEASIKYQVKGSFVISQIFKLSNFSFHLVWDEKRKKRRNFAKRGERMSIAEAQKLVRGALQHDPAGECHSTTSTRVPSQCTRPPAPEYRSARAPGHLDPLVEATCPSGPKPLQATILRKCVIIVSH